MAAGSPKLQRSSGILLHPTSLPGPHGVGELGPEAIRFLDFLHRSGQKLWQVLPLGPAGAANSPYASYSAFAGNPLLVSLDRLVRDGLLQKGDLRRAPKFPRSRVEYDAVSAYKMKLLRRAHGRFGGGPDFDTFCQREAGWLDDYALFMALKDSHGGAAWNTWQPELVTREPEALVRAHRELDPQVAFHKFVQYLFSQHYAEIRREADARGIKIIGDIPIFAAFDSADVWTHSDIFHLDAQRQPTVVAGVPPDYFSATGQLWGNPLYNWDALERDRYAWWVQRIRRALDLYDLVRIDHFRGFESYWEIPAEETTAINGRWVKGPGARFFHTLSEQLGGELPIIAEDLGIITPEVEQLRDALRLPGMKVLQFAFSDPANFHLPHNYAPDSVVYTGTHDNDTTRGWWKQAEESERNLARRYLGRKRPRFRRSLDREGAQVCWDLIRAAMASVSVLAVVPLQDVLALGSEARMNTPGTTEGNWEWRLHDPSVLTSALSHRLRDLTELYNR
ncbi:MAG: 4-alpha-glucanotransferase [Chloroflexota bacterium]|nr:4-alpha-glucanotransferase [Chloroflexota bacterium]